MRRNHIRGLTCLAAAGLLLPAMTLRGEDEPAGSIVASKGSKVFHNRVCASAKKLNLEAALRFKTDAEAQASGRRLCKVCADMAAREPKAAAAESPPEKAVPSGTNGHGTNGAAATSQPAEPVEIIPVTATIKKVLPGGTLQSETGETFGLIGIVCPQADQPLAKETIRFIREQTRGRKVRIRAESSGARRDSLGRLQVYLFAQPGERDLGDELLFQGLAWVDRGMAFDRHDRYLKQEHEGWWNKRGIWTQVDDEAGNAAVTIGRHAANYHSPDCPHTAQLTQPQTVKLNEAKARRLTPCAFYRPPGAGATAARSDPWDPLESTCRHASLSIL